MKKLFSASILLFGLTNTVLAAALEPPIPDPSKIPPVSKNLVASVAAALEPPIPDPSETTCKQEPFSVITIIEN
jgi:hypothetical protein